jgi:hypothetical protein
LNVATSSILNLEELLTRVDGDRELLVELFFIFKSGCRGNFQRLRECHTFEGILLNLSAPRAAAAARELENLARKRQFVSMTTALAELESEVLLLLA